ncbi:MAG: WecB/TagA/CpsF family glycosyltransferase [Limisphaerales bacterium]
MLPASPPMAVPRVMGLLGTPLLLTSYAGLAELLEARSAADPPVVVDFSNTHIVTMRRHQPEFRRLTGGVNWFVPDGMPLIWCLNRAGAGLRDRVYGPTFMDHCLRGLSGVTSHYLVGGSEECGRKLREKYSVLNPRLRFVGGFHGRCGDDGRLSAEDEERVAREIRDTRPDFVWIGLGAPKQYAWLASNHALLPRGVVLTVGQAFDVNAGLRPDAPAWMQRLGLTWFYRLASEPARLGPRYLKYNSLFLFYVLWDGLRGRLFAPPTEEPARPS